MFDDPVSVAVTALVYVPATVGARVTFTVAVALAPSVPTEQVIVPALLAQVPWLVVMAPTVMLAGTLSFSVTPVAVPTLAFLRLTEKVAGDPWTTEAGLTVSVAFSGKAVDVHKARFWEGCPPTAPKQPAT